MEEKAEGTSHLVGIANAELAQPGARLRDAVQTLQTCRVTYIPHTINILIQCLGKVATRRMMKDLYCKCWSS